MIKKKLALCLILLVAFTGNLSRIFAQAQSTQKQLPIFVNVTKQAGIDFTHSFGDENLSSILETTGPGGAFLDYDRDGDLDIYLVNGAHLPGINDPYPAGRDPKNQLYNHLYHNNGDGTFTDVTQKAGVAGPQELKGFPKWSVHACFLDYDKDGYLDLYVGNYLAFDPKYRYFFAPTGFPGPLDYQGQPDILYHNNGDGRFTEGKLLSLRSINEVNCTTKSSVSEAPTQNRFNPACKQAGLSRLFFVRIETSQSWRYIR